MPLPNTPIVFPCGATMKNRFMLAPMTNTQSYEDGQLSDEEFHWLVKRAKGQFGLVMSCAAHVQAIGQGFPRQLGVFSDQHITGLSYLSEGIKKYGSLAVVQLYHGGNRSPEALIGEAAVCPSADSKSGARALTLDEVKQLRTDFIKAAVRVQKSGFDGVEVHGAHGYILTQFLSAEINKREDEYGGSLENRARLLLEIIAGIRESCGTSFLLGVRLSPEKFGMQVDEIKWLCQRLVEEEKIDFLDLSLWDCFKNAEEEKYKNDLLVDIFSAMDLKKILLTVAGKIQTGKNVQQILNSGVDFVTIGRAAILHHDFPQRVIDDPEFVPVPLPVSEAYLQSEGLGEKFITYMKRWAGFVEEE